MAEAIRRIEIEAAAGRDAFLDDEKTQIWMVHHLQIIGEAVRAVLDQLKTVAPEYPWSQVVGMRHILVHDYFGIDLNEVWNVVANDLPKLKETVRGLLAQEGST